MAHSCLGVPGVSSNVTWACCYVDNKKSHSSYSNNLHCPPTAKGTQLYLALIYGSGCLLACLSVVIGRVPIRVSHVAIGESSKELAKPNLWILAILAKSNNISFS